MSEVKVNKVSPRSGTTVTIGDSGDTINIVGTLQNNGSPLAGDISSVVAGTGLSGGATSGVATLNIEAAQPTITSLGTITGFTSTGIDDNATSTAITINSSENVGIGATTPLHKLEVKDGEFAVRQTSSSSSPNIKLINDVETQIFLRGAGTTRTNPGAAQGMPQLVSLDGYDLFISADGNNNIPFTTNRSERMRLTSTGLGIGTTSPSTPLDIRSFNGTRTTGGVSYNLGARIRPNDEGGLDIGSTSTDILLQSMVDNGDMVFGVRHASSNVERMRIEADGDVGIGETAPLGKLHVKTGDSGISSVSGGANELVLEGSGDTGMCIVGGTSSSAQILFGDSGSSFRGAINYDNGSDSLIISTSATERMRIDSAGHVTKPSQPAVHAYLNTTQSNIPTGFTTVQLNAEIYDVNSDFNTSTYTFTAPVTGKYLVTMNLILTDVDTAFQWIYLVGVASNRYYYLNQIDPRMLAQDGTWSWVGSSLVDMDANDTFIMRTRSSAHGAAQMDIAGGTANATETTMTMTLLS